MRSKPIEPGFRSYARPTNRKHSGARPFGSWRRPTGTCHGMIERWNNLGREYEALGLGEDWGKYTIPQLEDKIKKAKLK